MTIYLDNKLLEYFSEFKLQSSDVKLQGCIMIEVSYIGKQIMTYPIKQNGCSLAAEHTCFTQKAPVLIPGTSSIVFQMVGQNNQRVASRLGAVMSCYKNRPNSTLFV